MKYYVLIEKGMTEKSAKEAMKIIEDIALKKVYEKGLNKGRRSGIVASIRAINRLKNGSNVKQCSKVYLSSE